MSDGWIDDLVEDTEKQFEAIPDDTICKVLIERAADVERDAVRYYQIRYRVLDGKYRNRCIFQKFYLFPGHTPEYMSSGVTRVKNDQLRIKTLFIKADLEPLKSLPSIEKVQELIDKMVVVQLGLFNAPASNGYPAKDYNWIKEYMHVSKYNPNSDSPEQKRQKEVSKAKEAVAEQKEEDDSFDDDIPF